MTTAEMLAFSKSVADATNSTFYSDTIDWYPYLASGQNECVQYLLGIEEDKREANRMYRHPELAPLITLDTLNTTSVMTNEYSLPSDWLATYRASYNNIATGSPLLIEANEISYEEVNAIMYDYYRKPFNDGVTDRPRIYYYIRLTYIGFLPGASSAGANRYEHYYYKKPSAIASAVQPTLRPRTHEAICYMAIHLALEKDDRIGDKFYQKAINILSTIKG